MDNLKNLESVNNDVPIIVDYNHMDEEGGVVLDTLGSIESIKEIPLREGEVIWISDTQIEYFAVLIRRRSSWVAIPLVATRNEL